MLLRCLRSDYLKVRHSVIIWLHLIIPVICAFTFLAYFAGGTTAILHLYADYLEAISISLPMLIGIICGVVAVQEEGAANYQVVLGGPVSKEMKYTSKLLMLLILTSFSLALAIGIFVVGLSFGLDISSVPYSVFIRGGLWILVSCSFLIMVHLFISFRFGWGASVLLGGIGVMITALMITGLGDRVWEYIPWAWSVRFVELVGLIHLGDVNGDILNYLQHEMHTGEITLATGIIIVFIISIIWFRRWEGVKSSE